MTIDVAKKLEAGADHIERKGWWQDDANANKLAGTVCAVLSMSRLFPDTTDADAALLEFLGFPSIRYVYDWNDAPGQTKENVIATMRACAAIWRAKHEESANVVAVESSAETVSA